MATRPPQQRMLELLTGHWIAQMLFAIVELGVADALNTRALAADVLADRVGANGAYLRRVLRALASVGVFAEDDRGRFKLTPLGRTLRADSPGSLRDFALMIVAPYNYRSWERITDAVRTGSTAFDLEHGTPIFEYLRNHPADDRRFSASMASISSMEVDAIAAAYPFARLRTLVDVGGAHGHLLATILKRYKKLRGVLFDQPQVVANAAASGFIKGTIAARCEVVAGSFFDGVPAGADAYMMKYIIHDWDDAKATRILENCRSAMADGGRVLVVDRVIKPGNSHDWSKWLDINMIAGPGGQERTKAEFADLFARAGLRLAKVYRTASPVSILEAVPA